MSNSYKGWELLYQMPGGTKDPFQDPYGPTSECFSSNDVVRMFELGALSRDVSHLSRCKECRERVERFGEVTAPELAQSMYRSVPWWRKASQGFRTPQPAFAALASPQTLVYVPTTCSVNLAQGSVDTIRMQLITRRVDDLRRCTLRLEGPVTANAGCLVAGSEPYPWVEFHNVQASDDVIRELRLHNRITELVFLKVGETEQRLCLKGTSNIEFEGI